MPQKTFCLRRLSWVETFWDSLSPRFTEHDSDLLNHWAMGPVVISIPITTQTCLEDEKHILSEQLSFD